MISLTPHLNRSKGKLGKSSTNIRIFFKNEKKHKLLCSMREIENKRGNSLEIKAGMLSEIESITGNESGLEWI